MSQPPISPPPVLTYESQQQLQAARTAFRKIGRAVSVAKSDGWTIAFFAGVTILFGLGDWFSMLLGAVLGVIAWTELRGATQLRQLQPRATRLLGRNQLVLGGLLVLYAAWRMYTSLHGHGALALDAGSDPELQKLTSSLDKSVQDTVNEIMFAVYAAVLVVGLGSALGMSRYYFSRQKYIDSYLNDTPAWIINMQKAGMTF
jgi:hypothetical protein